MKVEADEEDEEIGECTKCKMIQGIENCKQSIMVQLTVKANGSIMTLRAFDKIVLDRTHKSEDVTAKMLVKAKPFLMYPRNGITVS